MRGKFTPAEREHVELFVNYLGIVAYTLTVVKLAKRGNVSI
jgi:hypothetical protein